MILPLKLAVTKKVETVQDDGKQDVDHNEVSVENLIPPIDEKDEAVHRHENHHLEDPLPYGRLDHDSLISENNCNPSRIRQLSFHYQTYLFLDSKVSIDSSDFTDSVCSLVNWKQLTKK